MFEFLQDMGNYESRKVGRFDGEDGLMVSTARVSDGAQPFETAVEHPRYNGGKMVIVEAYDTREDAATGHARWLKTMQENPPRVLRDCANSGVSQFGKRLLRDEWNDTFEAKAPEES